MEGRVQWHGRCTDRGVKTVAGNEQHTVNNKEQRAYRLHVLPNVLPKRTAKSYRLEHMPAKIVAGKAGAA